MVLTTLIIQTILQQNNETMENMEFQVELEPHKDKFEDVNL